jgi:hypothetical protein
MDTKKSPTFGSEAALNLDCTCLAQIGKLYPTEDTIPPPKRVKVLHSLLAEQSIESSIPAGVQHHSSAASQIVYQADASKTAHQDTYSEDKQLSSRNNYEYSFDSSQLRELLDAYQRKSLKDSGVIFSLTSSSVVQVAVTSVQPAEFVAMQAFPLSANIEDKLKLSPKFESEARLQNITYSPKTKTLILKSDRQRMLQTLELLRDKLEVISEFQRGVAHTKPSLYNNFKITRPLKGVDSHESYRVFAFSALNHPRIFKVWNDVLMPSLSRILGKHVYTDYCASLVQLGLDKRTSKPYVKIETQYPLGEGTRELIRSDIEALYSDHADCVRVGVNFTIGFFTLLTNPNPPDYAGVDENRPRHYFSYNRPWECPGMGAPVGMRCSSLVCGTLGGYLEIDKQLYILTCAHTVIEARDNKEPEAQNEHFDELVSPPQGVLDELQQWFNTEARSAIDILNRNTNSEETTPQGQCKDFAAGQARWLGDASDIRLQFHEQAKKGPTTIGRSPQMKKQPRRSNTLHQVLGKELQNPDCNIYIWTGHCTKLPLRV